MVSKSFCELQKECFLQVNDKGFYSKWNTARMILNYDCYPFDKQGFLIDLAEMGLMHTEISEAMEEIRNGDRVKAVIELAGLVIRVMCYCENQGFNLEDYIVSELERNRKRQMFHGRVVI